jgi:uncharacterized protein (DUF305 family)
MPRIIPALALVLALGTAFVTAIGVSLTAQAAAAPPEPTVAALSRLSGSAFDVAFLQTLIPLHEEAVEIAMAATLNADHSELLKWNQRMVERKNAEVRRMLTWLQQAGKSPSRRMVGVASAPVKRMRALKGAALERVYLPLMAGRLEQAAALGRLAAAKATQADLRAFGAQLARVDGQEAKMLRGWLQAWYAVPAGN